MVRSGLAQLTKLGFRRDTKLFLAALVGFLVVLVFTVLIFLRKDLSELTEATNAHQRTIATVVHDALDRGGTDSNRVASLLTYLRGRHQVLYVEIIDAKGRPTAASGQRPAAGGVETITEDYRGGSIRLSFDNSSVSAARRTFNQVAVICVVATLTSILLLILYVPRILRPIEEMLDHARHLGGESEPRDEASYLIETFRQSIETLKAQEQELRRLHEIEKSRADDLERVTATLTRSLTSGFIALNPDGGILDVNSLAREILGIEPGSPVALAGTGGDSAHPFFDVLGRAHRERRTLSREVVEWSDEGGRHCVGLTTVPLLGHEDAFLGTLALFTDLTPIRALEARVSEMKTLADLGEISAGIAHEFRNSLSTILGYLQLAQKQPLEDTLRNKLQRAETETTLLSGAVDGLLNFARPLELISQPVDLGVLMDQTIDRLTGVSGGISISVLGEPFVIQGDPTLLARAFENLLRNALESIKQRGNQQGAVRIAFSRDPFPTVSIVDNGTGIDSRDADRLFLPFQSGKPSGFGMGLPLTRKIVLLHGGWVRLVGEKDKGATAIVEFGAGSSAT